MRTIHDITDLHNKKVLLRVDFDVPVGSDGKIQETFRIQRQKETIDYLIGQEARVVMVAHISAVDSFRDLVGQLQDILGRSIVFVEKIEDIAAHANDLGMVALLDNIRRFGGETANDIEFARALAEGFDFYVNNDFAVCHRNHASISAITQFLPAYAGLLVVEEVRQLQGVLEAPALGKVIVMGGAKAEIKVPVIRNFLNKCDAILVGGVVANDILKVRGVDIGPSLADENSVQLLEGVNVQDTKLLIPTDYVMDGGKILDIGPQTIATYQTYIKNAKLIIWNGPLGVFEDERFSQGTKAVAQAIATSGALSIIGGGDTIAAIHKLGVSEQFGFISTGGGAMLAFLAGEHLPGLDSLQNFHE